MFNKLRTIACMTAGCILKMSSFLQSFDPSKCTMQYTFLAGFCDLPSVPHGRVHIITDVNRCTDLQCVLYPCINSTLQPDRCYCHLNVKQTTFLLDMVHFDVLDMVNGAILYHHVKVSFDI